MMTKQRKLKLKTLIQESRSRLMDSSAFFSLLLMNLRFVAVSDMNKISTNGRCIFFSPDYIAKLYPNELDYILCHQLMHIIFGHIWRPLSYTGDDYHYACDILINAHMIKSGIAEIRYPHFGDIQYLIPSTNIEPDDLTAAEIFELIPYSLYSLSDRARLRLTPDSDVFWDEKDESGDCYELILDSLEGLPMSCTSSDLHLQWQIRISAAANSLESALSDVSPFIKRILNEESRSSIDWKTVLNRFLQENICDYSFAPPDRRFSDTDFFLPDFNEREFFTKEILFMVDTSGSISDRILSDVYSEMRSAIEQFDGILTGKLGFFDTAVTQPLPFESVSDLIGITPYGGGGTDFSTVFTYLHNDCHELPSCVIIFTDGYGTFPPESDAMGLPVLWIITEGDVIPPWGEVLRITDI